MIKRASAILVCFLSLSCSKAAVKPSDAQMKAAAKAQADQTAQALLRQDYNMAASKIYPKALEALGGRQGMVRVIERDEREMAAFGSVVQSVAIGDVDQILDSEEEKFAVVPETLVMLVEGGTLRKKSYLLAISGDGGRNWNFVDGAGLKNSLAVNRKIVPNLPSELRLPKPEPAEFVAATSKSPPHVVAQLPTGLHGMDKFVIDRTVRKVDEGDDGVIAMASGGAGIGSGRPASAPATPPTMVIERADYQMKVPAGSTLNPGDPDVDIDHFTLVNLPDGTGLMIVVIDDKSRAEATFRTMMDSYKGRMKDLVETTPDAPSPRHEKSITLSGKLNGTEVSLDWRMFAGKQKAFVVASVSSKALAAETRRLLGKSLDSFVIKE